MNKSIIFFDGICGLCNGFIDFVIAHDKTNQFFFSPLQSDFAKSHLPAEYVQDLKTVVVQINGQTYKKSYAVIQVLVRLGGAWQIFRLGTCLPSSMTDFIYDFVALNRYRFFGKKETCRLPTPEERSRFIL